MKYLLSLYNIKRKPKYMYVWSNSWHTDLSNWFQNLTVEFAKMLSGPTQIYFLVKSYVS